jgi:hypothetical protein
MDGLPNELDDEPKPVQRAATPPSEYGRALLQNLETRCRPVSAANQSRSSSLYISIARLPDFSLYNIPKWKNIPNYRKMYQLAIKYTIWP